MLARMYVCVHMVSLCVERILVRISLVSLSWEQLLMIALSRFIVCPSGMCLWGDMVTTTMLARKEVHLCTFKDVVG